MSQATLTPQQIYRKKAAGEPVLADDTLKIRRHIFSVLLENSIGALNRVVNLFYARGFDLESVVVGISDDPSLYRMTLVTTGTARKIEQVLRHLNNLVDTVQVEDLTDQEYVERELCLLKIRYTEKNRSQIMDINDIFRGKVIDITAETLTFELTGPTTKINAFVGMMQPFGIEEMHRSGRVAMRRALVHGS
ncbi:MAG: acetolactate synthase small subunit [Rhodothermales bacterium]|nr:acetolactate synthase small subunit [Rhodothermales bacterium]